MKICRIQASNLDLSQPLNLEGQLIAFERRLMRLWAIGILPSRIAKSLGITLAQMSSELDRLDKKLGGLKLDARTSCDYALEAAKGERSRMTKEQLKQVDSDLLWLHSHDGLFTRNEMALFIGVQLESLTHHQRRNKISEVRTNEDDRNTRNKLILDEYLEAANTGNLKGIISRLSARYGVSRKMVDLILGDHKVITRKRSERKVDPEMRQKHESIVKAYNERIGAAKSENELANALATEFGYKSASSIRKIIKENR
ncbi:hypothetical protein [Vibrio owensii]|uniref:hypothetical protein n=1 Tax=Vibrio owensii TaxID=696485 RepID=UPI003CC55B02